MNVFVPGAWLRLLLIALACLVSVVPVQADEPEVDEPVVVTSNLAKLTARAADDDLSPADRANIRIMEIFTSGWFFVLGSVVGSFLNVVIYRLPAGITLVRPPSRCPACLTKIQMTDNLPIIGWLRLKGRCRACGVSISKRYPLVEAAVGLLFLSLLHVELLSGGRNLPVREPNMYRGVVWIIWFTKWDLVGIYAAHALLLTTLLAAALIVADGHRVPRKLLLPIGLFALIGSVMWPTLHPVAFLNPMPAAIKSLRIETVWLDSFFSGWPVRTGVGLEGFVTSLAGACAGVLVGWCLGRGIARPRVVEDHAAEDLQSASHIGMRRSLIAVVGVTGLVLGWQAVLTIGVPALVAQGVVRVSGRSSWQRWLNPVATWSLSTLLVLLTWRLIAGVVG